jgi:diguanylate cyclase (GGDEF)-like protein
LRDGNEQAASIRFPRQGELDPVTGLPPRRALDDDLPILLRTLGRDRLPLSVVMVDIDHFKAFNDKWGHSVGDKVLRHVSTLIRSAVRYRGEAYRYGGEEITVLLPNADIREAVSSAERLCVLVRKTPLHHIHHEGGDKVEEDLFVTISLGVSSSTDVEGSELLVTSDQALYRAKNEGRDRVVAFDRQDAGTDSSVKVDVRFPAQSSVREGTYVLLTKWFSHGGDPTDLEAREISIPAAGAREVAGGPYPPGGFVTAEIRGRVCEVERRQSMTYFTFEVEGEILDLMYRYLEDREHEKT